MTAPAAAGVLALPVLASPPDTLMAPAEAVRNAIESGHVARLVLAIDQFQLDASALSALHLDSEGHLATHWAAALAQPEVCARPPPPSLTHPHGHPRRGARTGTARPAPPPSLTTRTRVTRRRNAHRCSRFSSRAAST